MRRFRVQGGFSLVELMVGMLIGLIGILVIMQVFAISEGQKRTTTSGSDAQTNGAVASFTIERDVRMAGYGFSIPEALGCTIRRYYDSAEIDSLTLAPIEIENGAGGLPDSITILSSTKDSWSIPAAITVNHPPEATNFFINSTLGMAEGDLLIAFEAGKTCTLLQITGIPNGNIQIHHQNTSPWNPPGGLNIFPDPDGYGVGASLFNLGNILQRTYAISAAGNLQMTDYSAATNTSTTQDIMPGIVNLQAQYGKDDGSNGGVADDGIVDGWDNVTPVTSDDWKRVLALRFALVARSVQWEKDEVTSDAIAPSWSAGTIVLNKNPDGSANPDWRHYRYKTFETVVPLRNLIWR